MFTDTHITTIDAADSSCVQ